MWFPDCIADAKTARRGVGLDRQIGPRRGVAFASLDVREWLLFGIV
jgi:hypothetical protein